MHGKIPEKIGRYVVDRLLGQGAMGSVYLGRDPALDRKVAIKTVRDLDLDEKHKKSFLERFKNEARAAARLSHPSIVAVYDVGEEDGLGPFLVLEYVPGSTLKHILRSRGALPPAEVIDVAAQIAGAIDVAHAAGIIHRDVKPDNILVAEDGRAKLADFGVARVPDAALTKEGQFLGTPCYAAPETLAKGSYSARSDLFSFAAVVYELVSGVRAFPGDDAISVAHAVVHETPPPPSEAGTRSLPKQVDAVVLRGLAKDPEARFGSAIEMVEALDHAFVEAGLIEEGSATMPARPARRGGGAWVFGGVLIGGAVIGVALVLGLGGLPALGVGEDAGDAAIADEDAGAGGGIVVRAAREAGAELDVDAGIVVIDAGASVDAGAAGRDSGIASMTRLEREDAAKDAIDRARDHLERRRFDDAERELARARELDPESSDLEEVEAALRAARAQ
ncbi:serine/threonine-protein kinase [Sandaracinus amylolyticus]|uniref:non-specific serine/threonine protein kinase n=1 Tax=Sandaracinus amylolyticus TaxID=927083 RepID=A0A0F6W9W9_9BACT|nr:serine/threonine-protein kinase [Sandaracinus amylolyticus]AKF11175.1 Serine/threonine protein kinase PrkC, regulator of stationary phase [Sandaracinus amylolyticus]